VKAGGLRWRYVPLKRQLIFNGLHGVISQKIVLFIMTTVRTSNPASLLPYKRVAVKLNTQQVSVVFP
jgi:hypothetical protein